MAESASVGGNFSGNWQCPVTNTLIVQHPSSPSVYSHFNMTNGLVNGNQSLESKFG